MSINLLFLDVLNAAINNREFDVKSPISLSEYVQLFNLAEKHKLLPLIFDKLYATYPYDKSNLNEVKSRVRFLFYRQIEKTECILSLYKDFEAENISPMIFKGIVCSYVYPKPDLRISSDEDILVSENDFEKCVKVLNHNGFTPDDTVNDCENHLVFRNSDLITIELHKKLFIRDESFYKSHNDLFGNVYDNGVFVNINFVDVRTFNYTENLLYLILHSLKHFTGRGVGIRQFCDIILFADKYETYIDWDKLYSGCVSLNAQYYAAAIFKIGKNYLGKDIEIFHSNKNWSKIETDETLLLDDVLSSGIYGKVSDSQTLSSVFSFSTLKNDNNGIMKKIFCSSKNLNEKYAYAKKYPILLPIAWVHRFFFLMTGKERQKVSVVIESMHIGKRRSKLFEIYKIKNNTP
ncbi:MAG: nucleotidyltransferase family protein [Eubacteriales bacterium]|nr:nucleotidyltransferase family protein [Eubacteriales bacterium]